MGFGFDWASCAEGAWPITDSVMGFSYMKLLGLSANSAGSSASSAVAWSEAAGKLDILGSNVDGCAIMFATGAGLLTCSTYSVESNKGLQ